MSFVLVLVFIASQMWGRGIPLDQVVAVCVMSSLQVAVGIILWACSMKRQMLSQLELLALGMVLGPLTCTIFDQVLMTVGVKGLGTFLAFTASLVILVSVRPWRTASLAPLQLESTYAVIGSTLLALSIDEAFTTPALAIGFVVLLAHRFLRSQKSRNGIALLVAMMSGLAVRATLHVTSITGGPLFPLFLTSSSDDQIKSEQLSYSIANWGLSLNSAAVELPIKFHWLSLGWAGTLMQAKDVDPFVVTLHFVPLFGLIGLGALLITVAEKLDLKNWVVPLAPFLLLVAMNGDGEFRFFFVLTTTNLIPHMWIVALVIFLLEYQREGNRALLVGVALLPAAIILGKGPYGVVVGTGLFLVLLSTFRCRDNLNLWLRFAVTCSLLVVVGSYVAFLQSPLTDSYYFSISEFIERFPFPLPTVNSSLLIQLILGCLIVSIFAVSRFPWLLRFSSFSSHPLSFLIVGGSVGGLGSFVLKQVGSETYFINAALTLSVIGTLITFRQLEVDKLKIPKVVLFYSTSLATVSLLFVRLSVSDIRLKIVLVVLFPMIIGVMIAFRFRLPIRTLAFTTLMCVPVLTGISNVKVKQNEFVEFISQSEQQAFGWVRNNTSPDSLFITDRYLCRESVRCGSGMPVASSLTRRRFLIEGARTLTPTRLWDGPYPPQLSRAASLTLAFMDDPNEKILADLRANGVTHAIMYRATTDRWLRPLKVEEIYRSSEVSVFSLESKTGIDDESYP
jgi:hypothetical protein